MLVRRLLNGVGFLNVVRHDDRRHGALGEGDPDRAVYEVADLGRLHRDLHELMRDVLEQRGEIDLLLVVAAQAGARLLADDRKHWVVVEHASEKAKSLLEGVAASCLPADTPRELHILGGDPYSHLMGLAKKIDADLIVASTHGSSNIAHLVMGSVAEKIARHATCPVLLVRVPR